MPGLQEQSVTLSTLAHRSCNAMKGISNHARDDRNLAQPLSRRLVTQSRVHGESAMSHDHNHNDEGGVSRRKVLECMTWAGTGVLWTISGGVPRSLGLVDAANAA